MHRGDEGNVSLFQIPSGISAFRFHSLLSIFYMEMELYVTVKSIHIRIHLQTMNDRKTENRTLHYIRTR
jgi:hypothetical protein